MIKCDSCGRIIMDSTESGGWKLRTRMILFTDTGSAVALCPSCKAQVPVPIMLGDIHPLPKPKLVINL